MNIETSFLLRKPYIAADPVSPLVAPITVKCSRSPLVLPTFLLTRKNSNMFPKNCNATSLNAKVGPWNSSSKWIFLSLSSVIVGVTLGTLKFEYDLCTMFLRAADGTSAVEMYKLKIWKASSSNDRLSQSFCQFSGKEGIASGINNPLSRARPLRRTSSKESYAILAFAK